MPDSGIEWKHDWLSYISQKNYHSKGVHLIVLAHGFQGNSMDVRMIKNHIALVRPDVMLMSSHMNEGETDGSIADLGQRLAY